MEHTVELRQIEHFGIKEEHERQEVEETNI